jgi:hypothetical protein
MKTVRPKQATRIISGTLRPVVEPVVAPRNDLEYLSPYETAAREIFVEANGLQVYYRTYYNAAGKAGWGAGDRRGDQEQFVWRKGSAQGAD